MLAALLLAQRRRTAVILIIEKLLKDRCYDHEFVALYCSRPAAFSLVSVSFIGGNHLKSAAENFFTVHTLHRSS